MKLLLMPNLDKSGVFSCVEDICKLLSGEATLMMADTKQEYFKNLPIVFGDFYSLLDEADFCVAIGGDGTIIHLAKHAVLKDKPVIGINLGRLGFLSAIEPKELSLLKKLKDGDYITEGRMMLSVVHNGKNYFALNDAVLSKGALSKMIDLDVACRGVSVGSYRADGIVFSTPTGSTAYNLSAGGPVIDASVECIAMTPVAPHSAFSRSIIFNADSKITVTPSSADREVFLTVDGEEGIPVKFGDKVEIYKSEKSVKLINFSGKGFYQVLCDKLLNK